MQPTQPSYEQMPESLPQRAGLGKTLLIGASVGLAIVGAFVAGRLSAVVGPSTVAGPSAVAAEEGGPTPSFQRQSDGGHFDGARDVVAALVSVGLPCRDSAYAFKEDFEAVQCWTGSATAAYYVAKPGGGLPGDVRILPLGKSVFRVSGDNWILVADQDPSYGRKVKDLIGGNVAQQ